MTQSLKRLGAALWRTVPGTLQWWLLWAAHSKFNVGVAAVLFSADGRVLLLKHVFRRRHHWGLPSGWMMRGERAEAAIARELREETGLSCDVKGLLAVESGFRLRIEIVLHGELRTDLADLRLNREVFAADLWVVSQLPDDILPKHAEYIRAAHARRAAASECPP